MLKLEHTCAIPDRRHGSNVAARDAARSAGTEKPMRLLLVEDHRDLAEHLSSLLTDHGHEVEIAGDGPSAMEAATTRPHDVIVLDRMLPGVDGLTVCRRLREEFRLPVPILMLTAKDTVADRVAGLEAGADDYLVKPFALAELEARLNALRRRTQQDAAPAELRVADLRYDPRTLEAERAGHVIRLNPSTRRILALLMQNTERVVSRAELERALWGDSPPAGDVLRAHVYALRNAVDKPFVRKLLHTVHGEGYRLAELDD
jgi:DNA-binding response OmpR family regulator